MYIKLYFIQSLTGCRWSVLYSIYWVHWSGGPFEPPDTGLPFQCPLMCILFSCILCYMLSYVYVQSHTICRWSVMYSIYWVHWSGRPYEPPATGLPFQCPLHCWRNLNKKFNTGWRHCAILHSLYIGFISKMLLVLILLIFDIDQPNFVEIISRQIS